MFLIYTVVEVYSFFVTFLRLWYFLDFPYCGFLV